MRVATICFALVLLVISCKKVENRTVDGQSLMTVFNTPLEDEYEKQYWVVRFAKQAAMDLLSYGNKEAFMPLWRFGLTARTFGVNTSVF
jgi:hypothetical protein